MNHEEKLHRQIEKALIESCDDALHFSGAEDHLIDAEYLLTVNAAKRIKELNTDFGDPYLIRLEYDRNAFASECPPLFPRKKANHFMGSTTLLRSRSRVSNKKERIDIAVFNSNPPISPPLCAIEVKGFRPGKDTVIADLKRNAEYFGITASTGESVLPFTFFIALHWYRNTWDAVKIESNIARLRELYEGYIQSVPKRDTLTHNVHTFTIREGSKPDADDPHTQEHGLEGHEDCHFLGVIITTKKRN